jgi:hypothetical protein
MSKFIVEINTDNEAFDENGGAELGQILDKLGTRLLGLTRSSGGRMGPLSDSNGNRVGEWRWEA